MNAPKNIVLVRHMQSEGNKARQDVIVSGSEGRFTQKFENASGRYWDLTPEGHRQAKLVGATVVKHVAPKFDAYYVSPAVRAGLSAHGMNLPGASWVVDRRLRERDYGEIETMAPTKIESEYPRYAVLRKTDSLYARPPGGESMAEVMDRFEGFLSHLHSEHCGDDVLIVTHGDLLWSARGIFESLTDDQWEELYDDADGRIRNGQVLHYSRVNPETGEVEDLINWFRTIHYETGVTDWQHIRPLTYTNGELLEHMEKLLDRHNPSAQTVSDTDQGQLQ